MHGGWVISGLFALLALCWSGDAPAQSVQCLQETDRAARNRCAEREIDDLRDAVRYWRRAAGQTEADVAYFENARARCRGGQHDLDGAYEGGDQRGHVLATRREPKAHAQQDETEPQRVQSETHPALPSSPIPAGVPPGVASGPGLAP